jgi:hypothetical protein
MFERQPTTDHRRFDSLCEGLEEYDSLPSVQTPAPADTPEWHRSEHPDEALDDQILAGLVTPS